MTKVNVGDVVVAELTLGFQGELVTKSSKFIVVAKSSDYWGREVLVMRHPTITVGYTRQVTTNCASTVDTVPVRPEWM